MNNADPISMLSFPAIWRESSLLAKTEGLDSRFRGNDNGGCIVLHYSPNSIIANFMVINRGPWVGDEKIHTR